MITFKSSKNELTSEIAEQKKIGGWHNRLFLFCLSVNRVYCLLKTAL